MKKYLFVAFLCLQSFISVAASEKNSFENPAIQVIPIQDTESGRQYELYIKLPEAYSKNKDTQYPVIYFTDALWHIEILSATTEYLLKDVILIGISWQKDINDEVRQELGIQASRYSDYTISQSGNPEDQAKFRNGQASNHLAFIRNDVIKTIENNYRTDAGNRTYFGYSLGGLFGSYILLTQPETFKNYILGSPALGGDIPALTEFGSSAASKSKGSNTNLFISYGSLEKELGEYAEEFITLLNNKNDESLSLKRVVIEGNHMTAFPMTGVSSVTWLSKLLKDSSQEIGNEL